ncbi:G protein beta subunit [Phaeodactylum tricornutum CCAP 1055/1]|uniref:G protein beta subunit n=2 Tax=Phaeodactylum tricornutum TaxID=2850 RepID=B7G4U5_PHATC|nr:G protein beta subunit [Phaeodactylum tricornutum CCAP 1055/1]EEC46675.1 G protein beta subunit [Phaeodactylum tricornutum CCAP 1055/1]|eukprot:XP_002182135.1 G protein beta subunit [Phaeodactylum tricornutum CCAP 1055/1]
MSTSEIQQDTAREEVPSLTQQIEKVQKSKREHSGSAAQGSPVRAPSAAKLRRTLKGHFGRIAALHWGGDSKTVVTAGQDGNLILWNAITSNKLQSIGLKSSYVMAVGIEQTRGNLVACGGLDNLCTIFPRNNVGKAAEMASHDGFLSCCRFLSEQEIITSSGDSTCILWDINTHKPVSRFEEHTADAMFLSLRPSDRNVFVSCSVDQTCKVWDTRAPTSSTLTFTGHTGDVNGVEFLPSDNNCFASCSEDNTVRIFDIRASDELAKFQGPASLGESPSDGLTSLAVSKSGRLVFCGDSEGNFSCFDILSERSGPAYTNTGAHDRYISCIGISPHEDAICTGSWDTQAKVWA